ncbi:MAG: 3-isopropylmalate dehydratase large subunit [Candidatus Velthaea sp.]
MPPQTLVDKIWERHTVTVLEGTDTLLYVDRCLVHEGFWWNIVDVLARRGSAIRRPGNIIACTDHFVPTTGRAQGYAGIADERRRELILRLENEGRDLGVQVIGMMDPRQGILHVVAPETGITQPGMVIVGSDSHTSTHGALGALAFGIGTTEVAHVFATQTLWQAQPRTMRITVHGRLSHGATAKDLILTIVARLGIGGGAGCFVEYAGPAIEALSIEERLTVCNMSIEMGARAGLIAPDDTTFGYLAGRPQAPAGAQWETALGYWRTLRSDDGARFDREVRLDGEAVVPMATWGTSLDQTIALDEPIPDPASEPDPSRREAHERALAYMGLHPGQRLRDVAIDSVFIGSCTNGRLDDLREAASVVRGRRSAVPAFVSPGSSAVKRAAEAEGIDRIFLAAGFEWRDSGCSMCAGANGDGLQPGQRCAATSNRNFPGRQGPGSRTHIMSPASAAASAIAGHLTSAARLESPV